MDPMAGARVVNPPAKMKMNMNGVQRKLEDRSALLDADGDDYPYPPVEKVVGCHAHTCVSM